MDENKEVVKNEKMDVEQKVQENKTKKEMDPKKKKILTFSIIGGVALLALILIIVILVVFAGKPSKSEAEKLVKKYLQAATDGDGDKFSEIIDTEGYIIYKEEGVKKFDKKYKDKKKYLKEYYEDNDLEGLSDAEDWVATTFENRYYTYYTSREYTLKEIVSIEKLNSSKKLKVIKAKVKVDNGYSKDTQTMKFYVMKVKGKYKIVGVE